MVIFEIYQKHEHPYEIATSFDNVFGFAWLLNRSNDVEWFKVFFNGSICSYKDLNFGEFKKWTTEKYPRGED